MSIGWDQVDGHLVARLSSDQVVVGVDIDRGAHIFELRDRSSGLNVLHEDPRGLAAHEVGGWYELFPSAGPACRLGQLEIPKHGDVRSLPWSVLRSADDSLTLGVDSELLPLRLEKTIALTGSSVLVTERLLNLGTASSPYLWGQHVTFGAPFIDHARVDAGETTFYTAAAFRPAIGKVAPGDPAVLSKLPTDDGAPLDLTSYPSAPAGEMLFATDVSPAPFVVANQRLGLAVELDWDRDTYPVAWLWIENQATTQPPFNGVTRALAVEPQTSATPSLAAAIKAGTAPEIAAGDEIRSWIQVSLMSLGQ